MNESARGWLVDVMACIESMNRAEFTLQDMYRFEAVLKAKHPDNQHIREKIRQQLQCLRDRGYLDFIKRGQYRLK